MQTSFDYSDSDLREQIELLTQLTGLEEFHASETQLTDISLPIILRIPSIKIINVYNTRMTATTVREFQSQNPDITVIYFDD